MASLLLRKPCLVLSPRKPTVSAYTLTHFITARTDNFHLFLCGSKKKCLRYSISVLWQTPTSCLLVGERRGSPDGLCLLGGGRGSLRLRRISAWRPLPARWPAPVLGDKVENQTGTSSFTPEFSGKRRRFNWGRRLGARLRKRPGAKPGRDGGMAGGPLPGSNVLPPGFGG